MTYQQLVDLFIEYRRVAGLRPATLAGYAEIAKRLARSDEPATALTPERTLARLSEARRANDSDAMIWQIYGMARRLGAFAIEQGILTKSPVADIPRPRKPTKRREAATHEQLVALLRACTDSTWPGRDLAILLLLGRAGLRVGELVALRLPAVDLAGRWILIDQDISKSRRDRKARLDIETRDALHAWLDARPVAASNHLFLSHNRRAALTTTGVRQLLRRLSKTAGINRVTPHQLRHLFATELADSGVNLAALMSLAGWSDTRTAMIYIHSSQTASGAHFDRARGIKEAPAQREQIAEVAAGVVSSTIPPADELAEVLRQVNGNVSAAGRLYDVGEAVIRAWVRDRGLVKPLTDLRKEQRERTQDGMSKADFGKLIIECNGRWTELGRRLGVTAGGARQRAERLGLAALAATFRADDSSGDDAQKRSELAEELKAALGNFSEVARRRGISPSSVWQQASRLGLLDFANQLRNGRRGRPQKN
jgi:site-specific recombinase XerD